MATLSLWSVDHMRSLNHLGKGFWETVRNIGWVSFGRIVRMGGSLVVGTVVVRYLGPSQYGAFSFAFALYGLFNIVSNLGLDYLVVSEIALTRDDEVKREILGTSLYLKVGASFVTTAAAIWYTWMSHRSETVVIAMVAMLSIASIAQGFDVVDYFFQARTRSRVVVIPQIIVFVLSNLARIAAVLTKSPLIVFGAIAAAEILITEIGLAIAYYVLERDFFRWRFKFAKAVNLLKASWPLLIASLLIIVYMRTDQVLLGTLSTKEVVGFYSAASKISEIWYAIPTLICTSVMPRLLARKAQDPEFYYSRLQVLYGIMAAVSIVIALASMVLSKYVILLLFGRAYLPSASVLQVHVWTAPFVFIGVVSGMQLIHEGLTKISLQRSIAGALCNVLLNYLLIPHWGAVGSATATLITQFLVTYVLDAVNPSTRPIFKMKTRAFLGLWRLPRATKLEKGEMVSA